MRQIRQKHYWPVSCYAAWPSLTESVRVWVWGEVWEYCHEGD
jgi:hypothetical protein